jgi:probable addiction module antidote protein
MASKKRAPERNRKLKLETLPFDTAQHLNSPERIAEYLIVSLETGDAAEIAKSIGTVARAYGMTEIARKTGLSRESLYKAFNGETRTEFETVLRVVDALGMQLVAKPKVA